LLADVGHVLVEAILGRPGIVAREGGERAELELLAVVADLLHGVEQLAEGSGEGVDVTSEGGGRRRLGGPERTSGPSHRRLERARRFGRADCVEGGAEVAGRRAEGGAGGDGQGGAGPAGRATAGRPAAGCPA